MGMETNLAALGWGLLAAISLPAGAALGMLAMPPKKVTSALMAFGAGALLFALSIELFGGILEEAGGGGRGNPPVVVVCLLAAVAGGLLFQGLNRALEKRGAFLRSEALIRKHVAREKRRQAKRMLSTLSRIKLLQSLPAEEVIGMLEDVERAAFAPGQIIFKEGDEGDRLYFIVSGKVQILRSAGGAADSRAIALLGPGDVFGEIALVSSTPRTATAAAQTRVEVWEIRKSDFDRHLAASEELQRAVNAVVSRRLQDLTDTRPVSPGEAESWEALALRKLERVVLAPQSEEVRAEVDAASRGRQAALSIWLGAVLDGLSESLVIGLLVVAAAGGGEPLSVAFVAGVFIANIPEAMSSSITMRGNGMKASRVFLLWTSLFLVGGLGALAGAALFPPRPEGAAHLATVGIEALAGGAMLTMIAETMLPEAFEQGGGPIVGISTLAGFLAAFSVKLFA